MTDKLDMTSPDLVSQNIEKIAALFPNCVTESSNGLAIDFDMLKQELSKDIVDGNKERYRLEWPGKREAIVTANLPINKTLRPAREESVDFDNTQNLYIEGDNLEVLKLLQESYLGKIKMIYIDPPYNTGKDFVYKDNFTQDSDEYQEEAGLKDEYNNRLVANPDTSGRYHSDWLTMMYPRLKLARNLLTDDGVIFISIDDNEIHNLRKISDEVFGEGNFVCEFIVNSNSTKNNAKLVSVSHEYILCYGKDKNSISDEWEIEKNNIDEFIKRANQLIKKGLTNDEIHLELLELVKYPRFYDLDHYTYADKKGVYQTSDPGGVTNGNRETVVIHPITGKVCATPNGGWRYKDAEIKRLIEKDLFEFGIDETIIPRPKRYLKDYKNQIPKSSMFYDSQSSTKWLKSQKIPFDFSKSIDLIRHLIKMTKSNDLILDFFSGSATTAHSVMQLNAEDGGNRKYIMVQVPEKTDEKSEAFKAGFDTICEIGKERIRRAAKLISDNQNKMNKSSDMKIDFGNEIKSKVDYGFRVYKLDSSNMQDVYYTPNQLSQDLLSELEDNIKPDRNSDDLVAQIMLDWGLPLSLKIEQTKIANKEVFKVADDALLCCFDEGIDEAFAKEIATLKPLRIVFRDKSFKDDTAKENVKQLLKQLSPDSEMKVI